MTSVDPGLLRARSRGRRTPFIVGLGVGLLMIPGAVWAVHQYTDVPDSHTFHDAISAVTEAGVASGTGGGLYKPQDPVTRGQMAAFLHRGLSRAAVDETLSDIAQVGETLMGSAALRLDGPTSGTQGVRVEAAMQLDHDFALGAGCSAQLHLRRAGSATNVDSWTVEFYADGAGHEEALTATYFTTQGTGTTVTYELYGTNSCDDILYTDEDLLVVQNFAFAGDGTGAALGASTLSVEEDRE